MYKEKERIITDYNKKEQSYIFLTNKSKINQASLLQDIASITKGVNQIILEITLRSTLKNQTEVHISPNN